MNCFDKFYAKKVPRVPALSERTTPPGEMAAGLGEAVKSAKTARFAYNLKC